MGIIEDVLSGFDQTRSYTKKFLADLVENPAEVLDQQLENVKDAWRGKTPSSIASELGSDIQEGTTEKYLDMVNPMNKVGAALAGAFRSAGDSSISRRLVNAIKNDGLNEHILNAARTTADEVPNNSPKFAEDLPLQALVGKISTKELNKYGTEEFVLDRYLRSTRNDYPAGHMPMGVRSVGVKDVITDNDAIAVRTLNTSKTQMTPENLNSRPVEGDFDLATGKEPTTENLINGILLKNASIIEDFTKAQKKGKTLYDASFGNTHQAARDLAEGVQTFVATARKLGIPEEDIAKKSLVQLESVIKVKEDQALKILQQSMEKKSQVISGRTAELAANTEAEVAEKGWVRLANERDLAQETDAMNHCIGAVGRHPTTNKYVPAFDTVSGKQSDQYNVESSFAHYKGKVERGTGEYYSLRPRGQPEVTVEVDIPKGGLEPGIIRQAFGKEDSSLTSDQLNNLLELANTKRFNIDEGIRYDYDIVKENDRWVAKSLDFSSPRPANNDLNLIDDNAEAVWNLQHPDLAQRPFE